MQLAEMKELYKQPKNWAIWSNRFWQQAVLLEYSTKKKEILSRSLGNQEV